MTIKTALIAAGVLVAAATTGPAPASAASIGLHFGTPGFAVTVHDRDRDRRHWHGHRGHRGHWHRKHRRAHVLPEHTIRAMLYRNGYRHVRGLDRHGRVYVARAVGYRGRHVLVKVSARSGRIISRRVISWR